MARIDSGPFLSVDTPCLFKIYLVRFSSKAYINWGLASSRKFIEKVVPVRLELEQIQDTLIARLSGDLDLGVADHLRNTLDEALDNQPVRNIILNLAGASFIDSSVLGVLLGRYKRVSRIGGRVCIVEPQPQVRRILELSGLLRIMDEFPGEAAALENIG